MDDKAPSQSPEVQTRLQTIEEEILDEDLNWGPYSVGDGQVTDLTAGLEQFGTAAIPLLSPILPHWSASARFEACAILRRMGPNGASSNGCDSLVALYRRCQQTHQ